MTTSERKDGTIMSIEFGENHIIKGGAFRIYINISFTLVFLYRQFWILLFTSF